MFEPSARAGGCSPFFPKPGTSGLICGIRFLGAHVFGCNISAYDCCTPLCLRILFTVWLRLCRFSLFLVRLFNFVCNGSLLTFSANTRVLNSFPASSGSRSAVFSISVIGVVIMASGMVLSPVFWTLSSLPLLVLDAVIYEVDAYSMIGRIAPVLP